MHVSEFRFSLLHRKEKGMRFSEFRFSFFHGKEKGNMPCEVDFPFPGRSKHDEIN